MGEACRAFGIPVVGGNVSLYNESRGRDIDPTPVVGLVGIVDRLDRRPPGRPPRRRRHAPRHRPRAALAVRVDAGPGTRGHQAGRPPDLDLEVHAAVADLVRNLVAEGLLAGVHDTADGLGVALAEMAVRVRQGVPGPAKGADHAWLFAESASRVVACVVERPSRRRRAGRAVSRRAGRDPRDASAATGSSWRASST